MSIIISDVEPRVQYTATAGQTSFTVGFEFFNNADLKVFNDTTLLTFSASPADATEYSVSGAGQTGGGSITLGSPGATLNDIITISRDVAIQRVTDFPTSGAFQIGSLNTELDKIIAMCQQLERDLKFSPRAAATTANTFDITFPNLVANKVLNVNSAGTGLEFTQDITDITTIAGISSDVTTVSGIAANVTSVAGAVTNINTVATNMTNINTVATNIADIITVANDLNEAISEIETVATDLQEASPEIDTVATNIVNVNSVGNNISNVNSLAGISADITSVAGISADVTTAAGNSADIQSVAGISAAISAVNSNSTNINAVNSNSTNINTVAGLETAINAVNSNSSNINTVAGSIANVNSVSGSIANVNTVAGINANITTVAGISADVTSVAGISTAVSNVNSNSSNINAVNANSANINAVAGDATDIGTVASDIANVNTVAGISSNVTTVANDTTDIGTVATNIANINLVGGSITNVNNVGSNIAGVNSFAERYRVASSDPTTSLDAGDLAFNTTGNVLKYYDGSAWQGITAGGITDVAQDSTPQLGGNLDLNGNNITGSGGIPAANLTGTIAEARLPASALGAVWESKTANFTGEARKNYFVDTSSNTVTATLPSSASAGDEIRFLDVSGTFDTNKLTIARNGHNIQGSASNLEVEVERAGLALVYYNATQGWLLKDK